VRLGLLLMTPVSRSAVVPYAASMPADALLAAVQGLLGDTPGRGLIQVRVVEQLPPPPNAGPGTELKRLLARVGITPKPGCKCVARAIEMDIRGPEWCEQNIGIITGWLREEAERRGLPFIDAAGRMLVRRAIATARKHTHATTQGK
jgi:hypothetical protein